MKRIPELDALRAAAVLTVVSLHAATLSGPLQWGPLMRWGFTAVDLFFVISGYLITTIVLRSWGKPGFLGDFYLRRSLRIWPIYYLSLLGFAAVNLAMRKPFSMDGLPSYLTFTQFVPHYWGGEGAAFSKGFAHTWSLAVEEQFYLVWPLVVGWAGRRGLISVGLVLAGIAVAARAWMPWDGQLLLTRCDGLALGGILAALLIDPERWQARVRVYRGGFLGLIGWGLVVTVSLSCFTVPPEQGAETSADLALSSLTLLTLNLLYTGIVGLCIVSTGHAALRPLRARWLGGISTISYGLYLFHNPLLAVAYKLLGKGGELQPVAAISTLALAAGLAAASWRLIESPILKRRGRVGAVPHPQPSPATMAAA